MGIDEIKMTYMTEKGAEKVAGGKAVKQEMLKKINGKS